MVDSCKSIIMMFSCEYIVILRYLECIPIDLLKGIETGCKDDVHYGDHTASYECRSWTLHAHTDRFNHYYTSNPARRIRAHCLASNFRHIVSNHRLETVCRSMPAAPICLPSSRLTLGFSRTFQSEGHALAYTIMTLRCGAVDLQLRHALGHVVYD